MAPTEQHHPGADGEPLPSPNEAAGVVGLPHLLNGADSDNWYQRQTDNLGPCPQGDPGALVSLCGRPIMNDVGSMTHELRCTRELVRQASQAESRRHQCVMGEIVGIVPHWL
jgi:hypothetical protein